MLKYNWRINMINRDDYEEPRCLLKTCELIKDEDEPVQMVPITRIIDKLDNCLNKDDYASAERLLLYWEQEAILFKDLKGHLTICNELIGLYRKIGNPEKVIIYINLCLSLLNKLELTDSISAGTTYLNIGTGYKFLKDNKQALIYYQKAEKIYLKVLNQNDYNFAGLYNNMGLAEMDLGLYDDGLNDFFKALKILINNNEQKIDQAITYLNIANLYELKLGLLDGATFIDKYVNKALSILNDPNIIHDGYYAFVLEKCASAIKYYGYFMDANELLERSKNIYEGIRNS